MKRVFDLSLHAVGGYVVMLLGYFLGSSVFFALVVALVLGYVRELEQAHAAGGSRWRVWQLSLHKHTEALAWPVGAALASFFLPIGG